VSDPHRSQPDLDSPADSPAATVPAPGQPPTHRPQLSAAAQALLAERSRRRAAAAGLAPPGIPRRPPGVPPPLSFAQERLWFLDQLMPGSPAYNVVRVYAAAGRLDLAVLASALGEVARRHESLRTRLTLLGGAPLAVIDPPAAVPLPVVDLAALAPARRAAEAERLQGAAARRAFDLARGPLLRAAYLAHGAGRGHLLLCLHHVVADGWSMDLFFRELAAVYSALLGRQAAVLPALAIQYADFALWQRQRLQGETLERLLSFWREWLRGAPESLELPVDRPRGRAAPAGALTRFEIGEDATRALRRLARERGATLFMVLLAAFHALLHRLTGESTLVVGLPVAGRTHSELEPLIGMFVNTLAVPLDLGDEDGLPVDFATLLARTRAAALAAHAHQELPFEKLVEAVAPERSLNATPLVQVMFALDVPAAELCLPGVALTRLEVWSGSPKLDLDLTLADVGDRLSGATLYDRGLFDPPTIARLHGQLVRLLAAAAAEPGRRVADLPLLAAAERQQLVWEWNDSAAGEPAGESGGDTFPRLFAAQAARIPERVAAACRGERLTYGELDRRAGLLARRIAGALPPGGLAALALPRGLDFLTAMIAVWKAGAAYLPLDLGQPARRLAQLLAASGAGLVLAERMGDAALGRALGELAPAARPAVLGVAEAVAVGLEEVTATAGADAAASTAAAVTPRDLAYVIFTSGSTGAPKGAMLEHGGMLNHLRAKVQDLELSAADRVAQNASQTFDVSVWQFLASLLVGGEVEIYGDEVAHDPARLLAAVDRDRVTVLEVVPSLMRFLLEEIERGHLRPRLAALRILVPNGEALVPELCRRWLALYPGVPVVNAYGPTECSDDVTHCIVREPPAIPGPYVYLGRAIRNLRVWVLDRLLQPLPIGVAGEICVGGLGVGRGYLGDGVRTALAFVPDPLSGEPGSRLYRTGDLGCRLAAGDLDFRGRIDQQVKVRGFRIELGEIEAALRRHPDVREAVALAFADAGGGQRLIAWVVPETSREPAGEDLRLFLGGLLPDYMVPWAVAPCRELPLTPNGKTDRRALQRMSLEIAASAPVRQRVEPRGGLELMLAELWLQALAAGGVRELGTTDNFFELGGNSLTGAVLVNRLQERLGEAVPVAAIFEAPTVERLARYLEERHAAAVARLWPAGTGGAAGAADGRGVAAAGPAEGAAATAGGTRITADGSGAGAAQAEPAAGTAAAGSPVRAAPAGATIPRLERRPGQPLPLSFAQERLWFLDRLQPGSSLYNIPVAFWMAGDLIPAALAAALGESVRRHEALRTTFQSVAGAPVQVVAPALARGSWPLPVVDLGALPPARRGPEAVRLARGEAARPFDLARGPLFRTTLLRLEARRHALLASLHHVIADGWALGLLYREMEALYAAFAAARPAVLPEPPIQYPDYAVWQRGVLDGETLAAQLAYWREALGGAPRLLELPTARPRPAVQGHRGASASFHLAPALSVALAALARREGVTLFITLLAAFKLLLYRHSGQDDLVVGTPTAGRNRSELEGMIGLCINTLALRTRLDGDPAFGELLARERAAALGAFAHQDLPFERLVDELQPERNLASNPLFQVVFMLGNAAADRPVLAGLAVAPLAIARGTSKFDLALACERGEGGMSGVAEYNRDLFDPADIARLLDAFEALLTAAAGDPARRISGLPPVGAALRHQILHEWNDAAGASAAAAGTAATAAETVAAAKTAAAATATAAAATGTAAVGTGTVAAATGTAAAPGETAVASSTLHGLFARQAARTPGAVAVLFGGGEAAPRLTYAELEAVAGAGAAALQAHGVAPGRLVAVYMDRCLEMVPALLAILKTGAAYVPLSTRLPPARIAYILSAMEIRHVVTHAPRRPEVESWRYGTPAEHVLDAEAWHAAARGESAAGDGSASSVGPALLRSAADQPANGLRAGPSTADSLPSDPEGIAYIIFTSGSTGTPKGVMVQHRPAVALVEWVNRTFGLGAADRVLFTTSLSFDLSVFDVFGLLAAGGSIRIATEGELRDPRQLAGALEAEPITFWDSAPAALQQVTPFLRAAPSRARPAPTPPALSLVFLSGDWIPLALPDRVREAFPGARVVGLGGATEATVWSNHHPIGEVRAEWKSIPYGRPIEGALYHVLDRELAVCPIGVPGDLYIGGGCLSLGYAGAPELTAAKYLPDPFAKVSGGRLYRTGDRARHWADGTLEFLGRRDTQVKVRGFRIELGEIEAVLGEHPNVREAVVLAREDTPGDRRLVAYFIPAAEQTPRSAELRTFLAGRLPDYMVPAAYVACAGWPLSPTGKLDRKALPAPEARAPGDGGAEPPRTPLERTIAGVWAEVLGLAVGGRDDGRDGGRDGWRDGGRDSGGNEGRDGKGSDGADGGRDAAVDAGRGVGRDGGDDGGRDAWGGVRGDAGRGVGRDENFFDLGGHSLLLVQVQSRLAAALGLELSMIDLFQHATVAALAELIEKGAATPGPGAAVPGSVPAAVAAVDAPAPHVSDPSPAAAATVETPPAPALGSPPRESAGVRGHAGSEIAVIGLAGRFPGAADLDEFWQNLRAGVESIRFFTRDELLAAGVDPLLAGDPSYVPAKGVLAGADLFDARFFDYSPREAQIMDPQQRLFLECAWTALEDAGYAGGAVPGGVGVFAGTAENSYAAAVYGDAELMRSVGPFQASLANKQDYLPARVSYKLGLEGPSVNVQTACSTSLVAVHLACRSLLDGECELALAGGVSVRGSQREGYRWEQGGIASPDGHTRAFDAAARGTVTGNGVGVVVLRRLAGALAAGDAVRAVIRGSAVNNDGSRKAGFTAPSVDGQARVIRRAQQAAGVSPETITYVEAHGTGTELGDPIEVAGLEQAFRAGTERAGFCALGSVKTNIGHLDAAAGVAGLIKTVLALEHELLPPSLHFSRPNPRIELAGSPFYVNAALAPWARGAAPRRAGVSAFGIGGTNAHLVLEEAPAPVPPAPSRGVALLVLSARSAAALDAATASLAAHLERRRGDLAELADVAWTLQVGRRRFRHRRVLVAAGGDDVVAALRGPGERLLTRAEAAGARRVAFLFPGQGAQHPGMAAAIYESEPRFRAELDRCAELLAPRLGIDLRGLLWPRQGAAEAARRLGQTAFAQPALFAVEYALAQLWMSWGIAPQAMIGHSIGEYVAACLAGVFSLADALRLVAERGKMMQEMPPGSMLAAALGETEARALLAEATEDAEDEGGGVEGAGAGMLGAWGSGAQDDAGSRDPEAGESGKPCAREPEDLGEEVASGEARRARDPREPGAGGEAVGIGGIELAAINSLRIDGTELAAINSLRIGGTELAAINSPAATVFSGGAAAIERLRVRLVERGVEHRLLRTSHAFHSAAMEPVVPRFAALLRQVTLAPPRLPFVSNLTGTWITDAEATAPDYWARHLRRPVRFAAGLTALAADPDLAWLEVGPGRTLSTLARQQAARPVAVVPSLAPPAEREGDADLAALFGALGRLWLLGAEVDWRAVSGHERRRRVPLPGYPFERQRYWVEARRPQEGAAPVQAKMNEEAAAPPSTSQTRRGSDQAEDAAAPIRPAAIEARPERPEVGPPAPQLERAAPELEPAAAPGSRDEGLAAYVAPRGPVEHAIAVVWQQVLGVERVGIHDDFFELGGSSLMAVQLAGRLRQALAVEIGPTVLLEATTVADLAAYVEDLRAAAAAEQGVETGAQPTPSPEGPAPPAGGRAPAAGGRAPAAGGHATAAAGHAAAPRKAAALPDEHAAPPHELAAAAGGHATAPRKAAAQPGEHAAPPLELAAAAAGHAAAEGEQASGIGESEQATAGPAAAPAGAGSTAARRAAGSCLVRVHAAGGRRPLFLVHQVGGHVYSFRALVRELGKERPLYGLRSRGLEEGEDPFATVEEMARHYLDRVHEVQAHGPYLLGGASMGGMVAFEMAQQLRAAGEEVELLALMDTPCGDQMPSRPGDADVLRQVLPGGITLPYEELRGLGLEEQLRRGQAAVEAAAAPAGEAVRSAAAPADARVAVGTASAEGVAGSVAAPPGGRAEATAPMAGGNVEASGSRARRDTENAAAGTGFGFQQALRLLRVLHANVAALYSYQPRNYPGAALFFRASERPPGEPQHPELPWIGLAAAGCEVHVVPGNHHTMHEPPHVRDLAARLRRRLTAGGL
jgi:amino acid adenylation domain-containing protein